MKISSLALLAVLAVERAHSFVTPPRANVAPIGSAARSVVVEMATENDDSSADVSIPYDSAVELAYKEWIEAYDKPYDAERYKVFQENYKAITAMNVAAKKKARETGGKASLLSLNKFADCTAEEYEAAMKGDSKTSSDDSSEETEEAPTSSGNILGDAVKAVESQASASSALQEAADALEAEEAVRLSNILRAQNQSVMSVFIHILCCLFGSVSRLLASHKKIGSLLTTDRNWPLNWVLIAWRSSRMLWTSWKGLIPRV